MIDCSLCFMWMSAAGRWASSCQTVCFYWCFVFSLWNWANLSPLHCMLLLRMGNHFHSNPGSTAIGLEYSMSWKQCLAHVCIVSTMELCRFDWSYKSSDEECCSETSPALSVRPLFIPLQRKSRAQEQRRHFQGLMQNESVTRTDKGRGLLNVSLDSQFTLPIN